MKLDHITWKICTFWGGKQKEQMPHSLSKKHPAKKSRGIFLLLLLNLFMEGTHMGKRLAKKIRDRKKSKRAALHHTNGSFVWWQQDQQDQQQQQQQLQQQQQQHQQLWGVRFGWATRYFIYYNTPPPHSPQNPRPTWAPMHIGFLIFFKPQDADDQGGPAAQGSQRTPWDLHI